MSMIFSTRIMPFCAFLCLFPVVSRAQTSSSPQSGTESARKSSESTSENVRAVSGTYRLVYTLTDSDAGRRTGVQHYSLTVNQGPNSPNASMKLGSKVPIRVGEGSGQFTFYDVGLNISARLTETPNGSLLNTKVEQSSFADPATSDLHQPVIRQSVLENTALLNVGKPVLLGSLDTPGSTHHLDIEVTLEAVK